MNIPFWLSLLPSGREQELLLFVKWGSDQIVGGAQPEETGIVADFLLAAGNRVKGIAQRQPPGSLAPPEHS